MEETTEDRNERFVYVILKYVIQKTMANDILEKVITGTTDKR